MLSCFSHVRLSATPWTVACQAPLSMRFPRQEYWSGLPCPPPRDIPDPGNKPMSPASPALQVNSLPTEPPGKPDPCCSLSTETPQIQVLLLSVSHVHISICMCDVAGFPGCADDKESTFSAGDSSSVPGSVRSPGGGNGKLL